MITPINKTKSTISPINRELFAGVYLLTEEGDYLLQENGDKIIIDLRSYAVEGVNKTKSTITPVGRVKS